MGKGITTLPWEITNNPKKVSLIENVHFYDTALLSSGTVYVITPLNDSLELFFDTDANITFIPDFTKNYNITGLISQNDFSSPFDEFYRLLPRFDADFVEMVTTNISQNKFDKIIVYPNPVLQGNSLSVNRNITACIYDVSGRIVTNVFNSNKISTIGLQKGVYLLVGDEINFKFIVE